MPEHSLTIALLPLDERPVNSRYPQVLGAIGGATVLLPPTEIQGRQRVSADRDALARWLTDTARMADAVAVSCDYLGCGNLIQARISQDSGADILMRLHLLAEINPTCPVHAFSLITRVSNADNAVEEPEYWAHWGTRFYRYARLAHQAERSEISHAERGELTVLEHALPADLKADWLIRRLRNHTVNLGLLDMAARGQLTSLLITNDDTSAYGFPTRERDWLATWPRLIGPTLAHRVMMHPGADEVGSALIAKLLNDRDERAPKVYADYSHPGGDMIIAPYEDRPVRETVAGQIAACGCVSCDDPAEADVILGVATPSPRRTEWRADFAEAEANERTADYQDFLLRLGAWQADGKPVALADVAYPNGSDPLLSSLLLAADSPLSPGRLAAYGAWNTAGNTLGTTVAQASCSLQIGDAPERAQAQKVFLAHRFLEDYGYQHTARREVREALNERYGRIDPDPESGEEQAFATEYLAQRLGEILGELQLRGIGEGLTLTNVRLPWRRTFEVDFDFV